MIESQLKKIFKGKNHKKMMLTGLYLSSIGIFMILGVISIFLGYTMVVWTKIVLILLSLFLYYRFIKSFHIERYAIYLILIVELDSAFVMLNQELNHLVAIYPFFIIFGFFFFFKLNTALWMTILHMLFWMGISTYGHITCPDDPTFQVISIANIIVSSLIATIFALIYYVSTELTYEALEHSNSQKAILLKEIHHRIKNNLNKISSIIGLQMLSLEKGNTEQGNIEEVLRKSKLRIEAMSMVHEVLYNTENVAKINFETYITNLTHLINQSYGKTLSVKVHSDHLFLSLETMMKIGLIVNELFTNTLKHASYIEEDIPKILILLKKKNHQCVLTYHQQSKQTIDRDALEKKDTLGMKLIWLTVKEMDAEMELFTDSGLKFVIYFSC